MNNSSPISRKGFALPMSIIAVAGLMMLLVGMLTVMSLERKTARSYSDAARAEMALESGLSAALASVKEVAARDNSIIFRLDDPVAPTLSDSARPLGFREQFFTYGAVFNPTNPTTPAIGNWRAIPLFSGSTEIGAGSSAITTTPLLAELTDYVKDAEVLGTTTVNDQTIPRARWVDVPATDAKGYSFRYAYWIEDLSGRIDGTNAGSIASDKRLSTC